MVKCSACLWSCRCKEYECAYCENICERTNSGLLTKYGTADVYECPEHGKYYVMVSPLSIKGEHISPYLV